VVIRYFVAMVFLYYMLSCDRTSLRSCETVLTWRLERIILRVSCAHWRTRSTVTYRENSRAMQLTIRFVQRVCRLFLARDHAYENSESASYRHVHKCTLSRYALRDCQTSFIAIGSLVSRPYGKSLALVFDSFKSHAYRQRRMLRLVHRYI
jgi:hypothetical protein